MRTTLIPAVTVDIARVKYRVMARPPLPSSHYDVYVLDSAIYVGRVFIAGDFNADSARTAVLNHMHAKCLEAGKAFLAMLLTLLPGVVLL